MEKTEHKSPFDQHTIQFPSHFANLPHELIIMILSSLSWQELASLSLTDRSFKILLSSDDYLWKQSLEKGKAFTVSKKSFLILAAPDSNQTCFFSFCDSDSPPDLRYQSLPTWVSWLRVEQMNCREIQAVILVSGRVSLHLQEPDEFARRFVTALAKFYGASGTSTFSVDDRINLLYQWDKLFSSKSKLALRAVRLFKEGKLIMRPADSIFRQLTWNQTALKLSLKQAGEIEILGFNSNGRRVRNAYTNDF